MRFKLIHTDTKKPAWIMICEHISMFSNEERTGNSIRCKVCNIQYAIRTNWR